MYEQNSTVFFLTGTNYVLIDCLCSDIISYYKTIQNKDSCPLFPRHFLLTACGRRLYGRAEKGSQREQTRTSLFLQQVLRILR